VAILAVSCLSGHTASFAAKAPLTGVLLQPSDSQGNVQSSPGYFQTTLQPGHTDQLYVLLGNTSAKSQTIQVTAVDAKSAVYGGISYNLPQQRRTAVGSWVRLSRGRVRLAPQRGTVVGFTVRVPRKARPGQYVGGLSAYAAGGKTVTRRTAHASESLQLVYRRVLAIVITVPGAVASRFKISRVRPVRKPDAVYLMTRIRNTGGMLLSGNGHLWVWRHGRHKPVRSVALHVDTTVPRTSIGYPIRWSKHPPKGTYTYRVVMHWKGGQTKRHGSFVVR
jgi:hypothetical protein